MRDLYKTLTSDLLRAEDKIRELTTSKIEYEAGLKKLNEGIEYQQRYIQSINNRLQAIEDQAFGRESLSTPQEVADPSVAQEPLSLDD